MMEKIAKQLTDLIGGTPLLELSNYEKKKELKAQHVLEKNDVLKSGAAVKDYFTRIDIRVTKTIKLYSKSAKLMTTHPVDSYTLDKDSQGQYTLRISNPQKFWSVSKFLVVVVK